MIYPMVSLLTVVLLSGDPQGALQWLLESAGAIGNIFALISWFLHDNIMSALPWHRVYLIVYAVVSSSQTSWRRVSASQRPACRWAWLDDIAVASHR